MNKVLIVDDHPVIRLAVRMLMERHGYEVIAETDNGVDALQLAREHMPDCYPGYWNTETGWAGSHCAPDVDSNAHESTDINFPGTWAFFHALHAIRCRRVCLQATGSH